MEKLPMNNEGYCWHFHKGILRDGSKVPDIGVPLLYQGKVVMCFSGLHASLKPHQALQYAPGTMLTYCKYEGLVDYQKDKLVCTSRTILIQKDVTALLRLYARKQALSVAHLWDMPKVVRDYLETGDEALRAAAEAAAWAAARDAARADAWDATRYAARADAVAAARYAAEAAAYAAAWDATGDAAEAAAWAAAYAMFDAMIYEEFEVCA
jgi:hypothetical protein